MIKGLLEQSLARFGKQERIDDEEAVLRFAAMELNSLISPWTQATLHEALSELSYDVKLMNKLLALLQEGNTDQAGKSLIEMIFTYWTDYAVKHAANELERIDHQASEDLIINKCADSRFFGAVHHAQKSFYAELANKGI